tara:strand:+ start:726 stop:1019 length:294 start_codon:yes stop_codon:yes gene_type:complete
MSVLVLLEVSLKPENVNDFTNFMKNELHHTRGFDGCNGLTVHKNQDDSNNMVIVEDWDSRQQYEKYLAWRTERGDMEKLAAFLAGEPSLRYYDNARV